MKGQIHKKTDQFAKFVPSLKLTQYALSLVFYFVSKVLDGAPIIFSLSLSVYLS